MKKLFSLFIALTIIGIANTAHARIYIPIDQPSEMKFPIAVAELQRNKGSRSVARDVSDIIRNDLKLSGYFLVIPPDSFKNQAQKEGVTESDINFAYWKSINAQALIKGDVSKESGRTVVTLRLFDPFLGKMLIGKRYKGNKKQWRELAHRFSDEVMSALTGIRGVFNTRIAFSSLTKNGKEIAVMDMDGHDEQVLTKNKSINISPTWSPDGKQLIFTSYLHGNPDLYMLNVGGSRMKRITDGPGGKLTPNWSPNGSEVAMASSAAGIANIYRIHPNGKDIVRLTDGDAIDISPTWSPNGSTIAFASERAGGLHLFKMNNEGKGITRLTYVGYQNDMPSWSALNDRIAFAGRVSGKFDIFTINPDGSNLQRLTINAGSNEHPSFSPDGRFIVFSSTRTGESAIYIMRRDGSNQTRISKEPGILPSWGPQR
jgi:TolB protein